MKQTEGLIKSLIFFKSVFGQLLIMESGIPREARSVAVGFSNPVESLLLERSELLRVEMGLVKRANPGCRPVFLSAVGTLDNVILGCRESGCAGCGAQ